MSAGSDGEPQPVDELRPAEKSELAAQLAALLEAVNVPPELEDRMRDTRIMVSLTSRLFNLEHRLERLEARFDVLEGSLRLAATLAGPSPSLPANLSLLRRRLDLLESRLELALAPEGEGLQGGGGQEGPRKDRRDGKAGP